ncbi:hypothetical protein X975_21026, partial [Stegodyphus mimosarum]
MRIHRTTLRCRYFVEKQKHHFRGLVPYQFMGKDELKLYRKLRILISILMLGPFQVLI